MSDTQTPPLENVTPLEEVVATDPNDTVQVRTVSGEVTALRPSAPRDGTIKGAPVYTDGHCPILVAPEDIDRRTIVEEHQDADGKPAGMTVHRYSQIVLTNPATCPTCQKPCERFALVHTAFGTRDCASAIAARANPKFAAFFTAVDAGDDAMARAQAVKHGALGERLVAVFVDGPTSPEAAAEVTTTQLGSEPVPESSIESQVHDEWVAAGKPEVTKEQIDEEVARRKAGAVPNAVAAAETNVGDGVEQQPPAPAV